MKIRLIDEWHKAHQLASVRVAGAAIGLLELGHQLEDEWSRMPQDLKDALPHGTAHYVAIAAFALVIIARLVAFGKGADNATH